LSRDDAHLLDIVKAARLAIEFKGSADKASFLEDARTQSAARVSKRSFSPLAAVSGG
jgi:uncharacterized protein with HEPN domain